MKVKEISSVMVSKHKMRIALFQDELFNDDRICQLYKDTIFEIKFYVETHEIHQTPEIHCVPSMNSPIPFHPNIHPKTGVISLGRDFKNYWMKTEKYTQKVFVVIMSIINALKSPLLNSRRNILNKKAAKQWRKGTEAFICQSNTVYNQVQYARKTKNVEEDSTEKWTHYIDFDVVRNMDIHSVYNSKLEDVCSVDLECDELKEIEEMMNANH